MKRILVTGNSGSGKTSLSLELGEKMGIPVIHLDKVVWGLGWQEIPRDEVTKSLNGLLSKPTWIIDGVSSQACRAADTVIFLDFGVMTCFSRTLKRTIRHLFVQRPEVPEHCPEAMVFWKMLKI